MCVVLFVQAETVAVLWYAVLCVPWLVALLVLLTVLWFIIVVWANCAMMTDCAENCDPVNYDRAIMCEASMIIIIIIILDVWQFIVWLTLCYVIKLCSGIGMCVTVCDNCVYWLFIVWEKPVLLLCIIYYYWQLANPMTVIVCVCVCVWAVLLLVLCVLLTVCWAQLLADCSNQAVVIVCASYCG